MSSSPNRTAVPAPPPPTQLKQKPQRILACILCQQRKIKCDRKFPCANCTRLSARCVPASLAPRERRRRYTERELLERIRYCERLLRENNVEFEPQNSPNSNAQSSSSKSMTTDVSSSQTTGLQESNMGGPDPRDYDVKNIWDIMHKKFVSTNSDEDEPNGESRDNSKDGIFNMRQVEIKDAYDKWYSSNDHLLFGSLIPNIDLLALHPKHVHIFRLWQIYLENVDPLLKVTHAPTLQPLIIDAASDLGNIDPIMEALMFSIYCISLQSITEEDCLSFFGTTKQDRVAACQIACQQALSNCGVLRTGDRGCLTALFLYLLSIRGGIDPRSLSSMLGIAVRIAQRMGLPNEKINIQQTPFEAEMRRRLWWALVMFDNRLGELSDPKITFLIPTWDCKLPLNVDDRDIRPDMTVLPSPSDRLTDALFTVVRSEMGEYARNNILRLEYSHPALKALARPAHRDDPGGPDGDSKSFSEMINMKYLKHCKVDNQLQLMASLWFQGQLKRQILSRHFMSRSEIITNLDKDEVDIDMGYALDILSCDSQIRSSPLTKGFVWVLYFHFPFPAYFYIAKVLGHEPLADRAERAWMVMNENYQLHFMAGELKDDLPYDFFAGLIMHAWKAREAAFARSGRQLEFPVMILDMLQRMSPQVLGTQKQSFEQFGGPTSMDTDDLSMPISFSPFENEAAQNASSSTGPSTIDDGLEQLEWTVSGWNPMQSSH